MNPEKELLWGLWVVCLVCRVSVLLRTGWHAPALNHEMRAIPASGIGIAIRHTQKVQRYYYH